MLRTPAAALLVFVPVALAAPPAAAQADPPAAAAAAPRTMWITLNVNRHEMDGKPMFEGVAVTPRSPAGTECGPRTDAAGMVRCRVPCDPEDDIEREFAVGLADRRDYDRNPANLTATFSRCRMVPDSFTVTYKNIEVTRHEIRTALGDILKREPSLPPTLLAGEAASAEVAAALAAIPDMRKGAVVGPFQRLASDSAALALRAGEAEAAATFSAYATAATNVMLADIARRYSPEGGKAIATSGKLADFLLNTGKAAALAEEKMGEATVPFDLQLETAAKLADVNQTGKLDGAAQADVYKLWNAHQPFAPMM